MYWEWSTLSGVSDSVSVNDRCSVLEKLNPESAKEVVIPVVRHIVSTLGISQPPLPSPFNTDKEIEWNLQVICFGLSLPLTDHEIIKDCVSIYCEWLSCLAPIPKICVPKSLVDRPNFFARKMINHLYHLFSPRKGELQDTINRQAVLCHRVLRTLQSVIKTSEILDTETWECILLFLIAINDALLSPPSIKEDIGDQLCDRVLSVLFEIWLLACAKSFPSPPLWKTLRDSCRSWRHRSNLFDHWSRINLVLTGQVLRIMYGPDYIKIEDDNNFIPRDMTNDCIVQTWYRFLHCLGNPVDLTQPTVISQTQNFLQYAIASEAVVDPCQHPCLSVLPAIFWQAMKGIATLVDAFLGVPPPVKLTELEIRCASPDSQTQVRDLSPIPPMRRLAKSFSVASSTSSNVHKGLPRTSLLGLTSRSKDTSSIPSSTQSSLQSQYSVSLSAVSDNSSSTSSANRPLSSPLRPRVNSILHLFGSWLFEAALISCEVAKLESTGEVRRTSRGSAVPAALPEYTDIPSPITIDKYFQGRAEALGTLCRIFCSKKTGEEILPAYLARFYIAIRKGLRDTRNEVLGSIIGNSANLLRVDLDGVTILVPAIVSALEAVLPNLGTKEANLRRPAIQLLLSLLPLPLHFLNLQIKDFSDSSKGGLNTTFIQLKPRLANLLINTLQIETDSVNVQMLLGGLMMFVTDTAIFEEIEKTSIGTESPTNLLSSENNSIRSLSDYSNSFDDHLGALGDISDNTFDSAHALFVRTTYLTCHRLISTWKSDLCISLAALELLNGLAKTKVHDQDPLECRRAVKWICDFIIHQCGRPPPSHSKDLHSSIVAAFQCVTGWITAHPYLLDDKETMGTVLEVVEYGISGTKSLGKPGEAPKFKDEKNQNPVSLRVRDAAEALLTVIFEQVGSHSSNDPAAVVDEFSFLGQIANVDHGNLTKQDVINHFKYYVIDHSILIALLEEQVVSDSDPQPAVTAVLRGPSGRHAWTLQLRHMARNKGKSFSSSPGNNPGRPLPMNDVGVRYDIQHRYFPESDRITTCKADRAIPLLDATSSDEDALEQSRLSMIVENQIRLEKRLASMLKEEADESYPNLRTECVPPAQSTEFQTARLLLANLGFSTVQTQTDLTFPRLVPIHSKIPDFLTALDELDCTSCRTCDTVHIFYVRAGQKKSEDILNNVLSRSNVHPHFMEFLLTLGWPVSVSKHSGWTGNLRTSWRRLNSQSQSSVENAPENEGDGAGGKDETRNEMHGGSAYNGERQILYWADVTSEIAFVVPTTTSSSPSSSTNDTFVWNVHESSQPNTTTTSTSGYNSQGPDSLERSGSDEKTVDGKGNKGTTTTTTATTNPRALSFSSSEFEKHLGNSDHSDEPNRPRKALAGRVCADTKIFVVWLESFEDSFHFPAGDLMSYAMTGMDGPATSNKPVEPTLIIFIQAMRNGLLRIHMEGQSLRMGFATPLIDGQVLSRRVLGNLVRQTALNMARRKRLENENFQVPHVRRKLKIQDMLQKFGVVLPESEFFTHFYESFTPSASTV